MLNNPEQEHFNSDRGRYPYRPDIDGLRAVAVLAVVIHHLETSLIPGGFVGVDVFFVISGFVVTQSILRSETGKAWHDLLSFWKRRWLRIIPALLLMITVTMVLFALFFAPIPLETYNATLRTGLASSVGLSNLYLLRLSSDYFQSDQSINVFLHTWSLGVEEQFYVVFSLLVIAIPALMAGRRRVMLTRAMILWPLAAASLWIFLDLAATRPMAAYYLLPARFWEMAIGSLIALHFGRLNDMQLPMWLLNGLQVAAVALLACALFLYPHPEKNFAVPIILATFASSIFIMSGTVRQPSEGNVIASFLGLKPLVFVGLLSYSIYLWHWPVLVLFRYTVGIGSLVTVSLAALVILAVSYLSFHYVEQKWRRSTAPFARKLAPGFALAFAALLAVAVLPQIYIGSTYIGAKQAWQVDWRPDHDFSYGGEGKITAYNCSFVSGSIIPDSFPDKCFSERVINGELGGRNAETRHDLSRKLVLVGDSHSFAHWPLASYTREKGAFDMAAFGHDGCGPFGSEKARSRSCREYLEKLPLVLQSELNPGDLVLLSLYMPFGPPDSFTDAERFIHRLTMVTEQSGSTLIIEAPLPRFERPAYLCVPEWFRFDYTGCEINWASFEERRKHLMTWLNRISSESGNSVLIWDPAALLCGNACKQFSENKPVFRDKNHLSYFGAFNLGSEFIRFINQNALVEHQLIKAEL